MGPRSWGLVEGRKGWCGMKRIVIEERCKIGQRIRMNICTHCMLPKRKAYSWFQGTISLEPGSCATLFLST